MTKPLVIAPLEAASDDNRVRKESNDSVTLTSKDQSPSMKNHGDGLTRLATCSPRLGFDVEYQPRSHYLLRPRRNDTSISSPSYFSLCIASRVSIYTIRCASVAAATIPRRFDKWKAFNYC